MLFSFLAVLSNACAEDAPPPRQVWLSPGFFSLHFDRNRDYRKDNWGVGVEVVLAPAHIVGRDFPH